jgi:hypothetical protein
MPPKNTRSEATPLTVGPPPNYPGGVAAWERHITELDQSNAERADRLEREYWAVRLGHEALGRGSIVA